ncbi:hypothetical protein TSUD_251490 [Trifolium subterraneum]|uniref:Uncharacterized protein n=1 Tax=Trifolium subterraneum TaxID=3900 RepID=A0A2Z6MFI3_TRISU|nr:hypothetical protein TSUD_251490 [Trifolium subterraneum]
MASETSSPSSLKLINFIHHSQHYLKKSLRLKKYKSMDDIMVMVRWCSMVEETDNDEGDEVARAIELKISGWFLNGRIENLKEMFLKNFLSIK